MKLLKNSKAAGLAYHFNQQSAHYPQSTKVSWNSSCFSPAVTTFRSRRHANPPASLFTKQRREHFCAFIFDCFICLQTAPSPLIYVICIQCKVLHDNNDIFIAKSLWLSQSGDHRRILGLKKDYSVVRYRIADTTLNHRHLQGCYLLDLFLRWKHTKEQSNKKKLEYNKRVVFAGI